MNSSASTLPSLFLSALLNVAVATSKPGTPAPLPDTKLADSYGDEPKPASAAVRPVSKPVTPAAPEYEADDSKPDVA